MLKEKYEFSYDVYTSIEMLSQTDSDLLLIARKETSNAYAPYSNFFVASAAILENGQIIKGTNQENGSYPVGICAERVLLGVAASLFPNMAIVSMAVTYHNHNKDKTSKSPISPCGMCRQALVEFEKRCKTPIRLIMSGMEGEVLILSSAKNLLPFSFDGDVLI